MNHLERSTNPDNELRDSPTKPAGARRKVAIWLLVIVIVVAMLAWLAFLGWGMIALWQWWVADDTKSLWTDYVLLGTIVMV
jgi:hypothetical protein